MLTLRKNQEEPISKAVEFFKEKEPKPSIIVLPTAWGKSILTAFVAKNINEKLLILQPSKELLEQNYRKYDQLCRFEATSGIYSASFGRKEIRRITYATIGSIKSIGKYFKDLGFKKMLIDEAHLYPREADSMLGKFLKDSEITHVLGITATPLKLQQNTMKGGEKYSKLVMLTSKSKKGNFFKDIIHVGQVKEMLELGYWCKLKYAATKFDGSLLVYNSSKSEYTEASIEQAFTANDIHLQIKQQLNENSDRKHILVFVPSVAEAIELSKQYPNSAAIWGEMDKRTRERTINDFRAGKIRVIFNVRVLSTGFDYTGIDCIILGISTASFALYYQIIGRATRIDTNKTDALIIDLAGNVERFGRVEDITFEKGTIWRMFGTDGRLLSGIPVHDIGIKFKNDVERLEEDKKNGGLTIIRFGKYKGMQLKDVPRGYRQWMLKNINWTPDKENLRKAILNSLQQA